MATISSNRNKRTRVRRRYRGEVEWDKFHTCVIQTWNTTFEVSDKVEVYCDHEIDKDRTRGWLKGIIVQIDNKLIAVQFQSNVFLTDGWMVPDRILWYPINSEHIRPCAGQEIQRRKKMIFSDY